MEVSVLSHTEEPGNVLSHLMQLLCFNMFCMLRKTGVGQAEPFGSKITTCAEGNSQAFGTHKLELPGNSSCHHQHFAHIWSLSNLLGCLESSQEVMLLHFALHVLLSFQRKKKGVLGREIVGKGCCCPCSMRNLAATKA